MSRSALDDDALMRAVARGDEAAFGELARRHRPWVRAVLRAFVRDPDAVEDLAQEAFCRLHRHAGDYQPRGSFVPWLKRIAVNLARDELRRRRQSVCVPLDEVEEPAAPEPIGGPQAVLESELLRDELRAAIQHLPDAQRLPVIMHYFGGMSLQDIAWAMKCPVGTVKSRLFNGLRRVRRELIRGGEDEGG